MKKIIIALLALLFAIPALAEGASDPFVGRWQDPYYGRAVLEISRSGDRYAISIHWGNSASSESVWEMDATREGDSLAYTGGSMAVVTYSEACIEEDVQYDDAEGAFTLTDEGKLLWSDSREERSTEFAYEKIWPTDAQTRFAALTSLDRLRERLDGGVSIRRVYYTDGYGFSTSEFTTEDEAEIESLWDALNRIGVVGEVDEDITDWYPQIVLYLTDGSSFGVRFDAHWLEIGGMEHYELVGDDDFWGLTSYLVEKHGGTKD